MSSRMSQSQPSAAKKGVVKINIADFLAPACAIVDMRALDKTWLLQELARRAAAVLDVPEEKIAEALLKREAVGSTGTGGGIALPHARLAEVKRPFGMLVRLRQAIDFEAVDGKPVNLVFLLLTPASPPGEQLNALACAARALRKSDVLARLRAAANAEELFAAIGSAGPH